MTEDQAPNPTLFQDLPIGGKFRYPPHENGDVYTKITHGGDIRRDDGRVDWLASHNEVSPLGEGKDEVGRMKDEERAEG